MVPVGLSSGAVWVPSIRISWTTQGPLVISLRTFIFPSGNALSHVMAKAVASLALVALKPPGALNLMSSARSSLRAFSSWALNAATKRSVVVLGIASPPSGVSAKRKGQEGYCQRWPATARTRRPRLSPGTFAVYGSPKRGVGQAYGRRAQAPAPDDYSGSDFQPT